VWEYFLETCHQNKSLLGITWAELRASLDRVEVRGLNRVKQLLERRREH